MKGPTKKQLAEQVASLQREVRETSDRKVAWQRYADIMEALADVLATYSGKSYITTLRNLARELRDEAEAPTTAAQGMANQLGVVSPMPGKFFEREVAVKDAMEKVPTAARPSFAERLSRRELRIPIPAFRLSKAGEARLQAVVSDHCRTEIPSTWLVDKPRDPLPVVEEAMKEFKTTLDAKLAAARPGDPGTVTKKKLAARPARRK